MAAALRSAPESVLSFDCGLRNLAAALVLRKPVALPAECKVLAHPDETRDEFHGRALQWFVRNAWTVQAAELIDVTTFLDKPVKHVKSMGLMVMAQALHDALADLQARWFSAATSVPPSVLAVEVQHNSNAVMRAVSLSISVFFMRAWGNGIEYEGVTGGQKLKLCASLGFDIGSGLQAELDKKAAKAAAKAEKAAVKAAAKAAKPPRGKAKAVLPGSTFLAAAPPPPLPIVLLSDSDSDSFDDAPAPKRGGRFGAGASRFKAKDKYEDNKLRSVLAMRHLLDGMRAAGTLDPAIEPLLADHNIADAVLQGVWVLWQRAVPRMPAKKRKRADET